MYANKEISISYGSKVMATGRYICLPCWLVGFIEDLRRFSGISAISRPRSQGWKLTFLATRKLLRVVLI